MFATPLALERIDADHYRASVEPMPSILHLYVHVDGARAFIREPSRNLGKQLGELAVETHGPDVEFHDAKGKLIASAVRAGDRLQLRLIDAALTIELTKRDRGTAPWFYARATVPEQLERPAPIADGWRVESPEAVGFDRAALTAIVRDIAADVPDGPNTRAIHALVIARHGALVVEEYFAGARADTLHDLRSAGKSISTTLAGITIDHGQLALHDPLYETVGFAIDDPKKQAIQLVHVLTMATGLACDDSDDKSPGNEDTMQQQTAQPDWYRYTLALPVANPAGKGIYCSGTMNLVGAMIAARTHRWLPDLLHDQLFAPLGITRYAVPLMPDGQGYFGGGVRLRARDFAKLAQLFVDGGRWHDTRVVSADWVRDAIAAHSALNKPDDYGYGWWRQHYSLDGQELDAFFASGNGGQIALGIPQLELVVVFQSGNFNAFGVWRHQVEDLVPRIVRAIRR